MTGPRLLADENIAASLVRALREDGIDVSYVAELASGITDDEVLDLTKAEARLLLTEDKDFGEATIQRHRARESRVKKSGNSVDKHRLRSHEVVGRQLLQEVLRLDPSLAQDRAERAFR